MFGSGGGNDGETALRLRRGDGELRRFGTSISSKRGKTAVLTPRKQTGPVKLERIPAGSFLPGEGWNWGAEEGGGGGVIPKSVQK